MKDANEQIEPYYKRRFGHNTTEVSLPLISDEVVIWNDILDFGDWNPLFNVTK